MKCWVIEQTCSVCFDGSTSGWRKAGWWWSCCCCCCCLQQTRKVKETNKQKKACKQICHNFARNKCVSTLWVCLFFRSLRKHVGQSRPWQVFTNPVKTIYQVRPQWPKAAVCLCHHIESMKMNLGGLVISRGFQKSYLSVSLEHILLFFSAPLVSVTSAASISAAFKQVAFVAYLFHHSFNDIKCFIYFSVLRSRNKTAAAPHLGTGDCCEEKRSNAAESILKEGNSKKINK